MVLPPQAFKAKLMAVAVRNAASSRRLAGEVAKLIKRRLMA